MKYRIMTNWDGKLSVEKLGDVSGEWYFVTTCDTVEEAETRINKLAEIAKFVPQMVKEIEV